MIIKCNNCGFQVDSNEFKRCPRCNTIVGKSKKCEECKGCSIFNKEKCNIEKYGLNS